MPTNATKRIGGFALLAVCSVAILAIAVVEAVPAVTGALAVLGLAAGALLVGTSGEGRPV